MSRVNFLKYLGWAAISGAVTGQVIQLIVAGEVNGIGLLLGGVPGAIFGFVGGVFGHFLGKIFNQQFRWGVVGAVLFGSLSGAAALYFVFSCGLGC